MPAPASPGLPLQLGMVLATRLANEFHLAKPAFRLRQLHLCWRDRVRRLEGDRLVILPDSQFGSRIRFTAACKTTRGATIDHEVMKRPDPVPIRGAYRDRHERWVRDAVDAAASGARIACWTIDAFAYGKAVWSWRPDAGVKLAEAIPPMTVAKEPGHWESTE
jgi:hypothetical protein